MVKDVDRVKFFCPEIMRTEFHMIVSLIMSVFLKLWKVAGSNPIRRSRDCKAGQTQKAMEKLRDMDARGVDADKITYMTIIQACYADSDFGSCAAFYQKNE